MIKKDGFTLTEVLLAVMIVGIIGVALASLTTAASRESAAGSSRIALRNNVVSFLRQLRRDLHGATTVLYVRGQQAVSNTTVVPLLLLGYNVDLQGNPVGEALTGKYVAYCFTRGTDSAYPSGAYTGGKIVRREVATKPATVAKICSGSNSTDKPVLNYVKYVNGISSSQFLSPSIIPLDRTAGTLGAAVQGAFRLQLIVELPNTTPVVNTAVDEIFLAPIGIKVP